MDGTSDFQNMPHFYEMGFDDILPISALNRINIALLLDKIVDRLPVRRLHSEEEKLKIAIVGRPNAGKSTLLNAFIGYERSIVSDIPGTTRDAVDEDFVFNGRKITLIDTAGIRKKSRITENVDFYSLRRAVESIRRCDVVIHLIDAAEGITDTDKKIADEIIAARKPTIIAVTSGMRSKKTIRPSTRIKIASSLRSIERAIFRLFPFRHGRNSASPPGDNGDRAERKSPEAGGNAQAQQDNGGNPAFTSYTDAGGKA